nr:hypothetical protein [Thiothrix nivea]
MPLIGLYLIRGIVCEAGKRLVFLVFLVASLAGFTDFAELRLDGSHVAAFGDFSQ